MAPGGLGAAGALPLTVLGDLTLQASSAVDFDFGSSTQRDEVVVNGTLNFPATGQVNINLNSLLSGSIVNGLPLFVGYGGISNFNPSAFTISASNVVSPPAYSVVQNGDTIRLVVPPPAINALTWNTNSGTWDASTPNWTISGGTASYTDSVSEAVNFGYISSDSTITVANVSGGGVSPGAITISNTANRYTFTGGSILTGSLTMLGAGTAELQTANAYPGGTYLNGGLLIVDSGDSCLGRPALPRLSPACACRPPESASSRRGTSLSTSAAAPSIPTDSIHPPPAQRPLTTPSPRWATET